MPLADCEDCGRPVSLKATSCPHCGCPFDYMKPKGPPAPRTPPFAPMQPGADDRPTVLVEQTAKDIKSREAWCGVAGGVAMLMFFVSWKIAVVLLLVVIGWSASLRYEKWWRHG